MISGLRDAAVPLAPRAAVWVGAQGLVRRCGADKRCSLAGDFRLQTRGCARVTAFFDDLAPKVHLTGIEVIQGAMERLRDLSALATAGGTCTLARAAFVSLVHPREAIIRFSRGRSSTT